MRTSTSTRIKQLEKATKIVDMLQEAYENAEQARLDLQTWDNTPSPFAPIKLFNDRHKLVERKIHWMNVAQRLEGYYAATMKKFMDEYEKELANV
jgi:hypothetical protein